MSNLASACLHAENMHWEHDLMAYPEIILSGVFGQVSDAHGVLLAAAHAVALRGASTLAGRHIAAGLASCLGQASLSALHAVQHRSMPRWHLRGCDSANAAHAK